jgi:predicted P-loop ATPase
MADGNMDNIIRLARANEKRDRDSKRGGKLARAITMLCEEPEWRAVLAFNRFRQKIEITGRPPWRVSAALPPGDWTGVDDIRLADWFQRKGIDVMPKTAADAAIVAARIREYHPVIDYLASLEWDKKPRLDLWPVTYLGAEDHPYIRAIGSKWPIGAIGRIMKPGLKNDCALILESPQGAGKSTAARTLVRDESWFTDELGEMGTKDTAMQLLGRWIIELPELDSVTRSEISRVKAFMSRTTDKFRPPYERHVVDYPRQCAFFGTINPAEYLRDETGNRRFWPITCGKIDIAALSRDRDQLWAEALVRYQAGEQWWLDTPKLNHTAVVEQSARRVRDLWEEPISQFLSGRTKTSQHEIANHLKIPIERQDQRVANRIAAALQELGWERRQRRIGGKREWRYFRSSD